MKFITLTMFACCILIQSYGQDDVKTKKDLKAARDSIIGTYCCNADTCNKDSLTKALYKKSLCKKWYQKKCNCEKDSCVKARTVLSQTFDSLFKPIFSTVILNNDDAINNGSAGSLTQDEETGKLSANYATQIKNLPQFLNFGFSVESNEGVWNLYNSNSWKNTIKLNVGYTFVGKKKGQYFEPPECIKLIKKRNVFIDSLMIEYYSTINLPISSIKKRLDTVKNKIHEDSLVIFNPETTSVLFESTKKRYLELLGESDSLSALVKKRDIIDTAYKNTKLDSLLANEITQFEMRNNIFTGYNLWWFNIISSFGNTQNKLYNDTLQRDSLVKFKVSDYARFRFGVNSNWVRNTKKYLCFFNAGLVVYNTNFLEKKELKDIPSIAKDATGNKYVISGDEDNVTLGSLDDLKKNIWILNPSFYISNFFILKRSLGFEFYTDYKKRLNKPNTADFRDTYSIYGGVIFRVDSKEVLSKATVGLDVGLYDAPIGRRGADFFSLKLKLGVPFNTIVKKKE